MSGKDLHNYPTHGKLHNSSDQNHTYKRRQWRRYPTSMVGQAIIHALIPHRPRSISLVVWTHTHSKPKTLQSMRRAVWTLQGSDVLWISENLEKATHIHLQLRFHSFRQHMHQMRPSRAWFSVTDYWHIRGRLQHGPIPPWTKSHDREKCIISMLTLCGCTSMIAFQKNVI